MPLLRRGNRLSERMAFRSVVRLAHSGNYGFRRVHLPRFASRTFRRLVALSRLRFLGRYRHPVVATPRRALDRLLDTRTVPLASSDVDPATVGWRTLLSLDNHAASRRACVATIYISRACQSSVASTLLARLSCRMLRRLRPPCCICLVMRYELAYKLRATRGGSDERRVTREISR